MNDCKQLINQIVTLSKGREGERPAKQKQFKQTIKKYSLYPILNA